MLAMAAGCLAFEGESTSSARRQPAFRIADKLTDGQVVDPTRAT
jgi:hypothetical protein